MYTILNIIYIYIYRCIYTYREQTLDHINMYISFVVYVFRSCCLLLLLLLLLLNDVTTTTTTNNDNRHDNNNNNDIVNK